ncbi:hypothetical protein EPO15_08160 [bacterium]|nr:MAG: hypothetical protein EPO15_08160 [bacterium]
MRPLIPVLEAGADRYDARWTRAAAALLGAAWLALVGQEAANRLWLVHAGELCTRRLLLWPPLTPAWGLWLEWGLETAVGVLLLSGRLVRPAVRLGAVLAFVSAQQRYMNQKALLTIVLLFLALDPPDAREAGFAERDRPNLGLLRWQLAIVYLFSALQKVRFGFLDGTSLTNIFAYLDTMRVPGWAPAGPMAAALAASPALAKSLSWGVVGGELALIPLSLAAPRVALVGVAVLHGAFSLFMPDVLSFTLTMLACGCVCAGARTVGTATNST